MTTYHPEWADDPPVTPEPDDHPPDPDESDWHMDRLEDRTYGGDK